MVTVIQLQASLSYLRIIMVIIIVIIIIIIITNNNYN